MLRYILLINALIEGLAGFVLIMVPSMLLRDEGQAPQTIAVSRLYGILALIFGILSFLLYRRFEYNHMYRQICLAVVSFHLIVAFYFYSLYGQHLTASIGPFILHLILAVGFMGLYLKEMEKFPAHG